MELEAKEKDVLLLPTPMVYSHEFVPGKLKVEYGWRTNEEFPEEKDLFVQVHIPHKDRGKFQRNKDNEKPDKIYRKLWSIVDKTTPSHLRVDYHGPSDNESGEYLRDVVTIKISRYSSLPWENERAVKLAGQISNELY
jgi:hypothetical protein